MELQHALTTLRTLAYSPSTPQNPFTPSALRSLILQSPSLILIQYALNLRDTNVLDPKSFPELRSTSRHAQGLLHMLSLPEVCWKNADLAHADLRKSVLARSDLRNANLSYTNLRNADLHRADLRNADLRNSVLYCTNLRGADLRGADLQDARLDNAICDETTQWPAGFDSSDARILTISSRALRRRDLSALCIDHQDLSHFDLSGTIFPIQVLGVKMQSTNLANTQPSQTTFSDTDFTRADFGDISMDHTMFKNCTLDRARMHVQRATTPRPFDEHTTLRNIVLSESNLATLDLSKLNISGAQLSSINAIYTNFTHCDLSHSNLSYANLSHANLTQANLYGADLSRSALNHANLYGADLHRANLSHTNLRHSNLKQTNLENALLYNTDLRGAQYSHSTRWPKDFQPEHTGAFGPNADFRGQVVREIPRGCDLHAANFSESILSNPKNKHYIDCSMHNAKLIRVQAAGVYFNGVTLSNADLRGANLRGAVLYQCRMVSADLRGADLRGAWITRCNLRGAVWDQHTRWPKHYTPRSNVQWK